MNRTLVPLFDLAPRVLYHHLVVQNSPVDDGDNAVADDHNGVQDVMRGEQGETAFRFLCRQNCQDLRDDP